MNQRKTPTHSLPSTPLSENIPTLVAPPPGNASEESRFLAEHKARHRVLRPGLSFHFCAETNHVDYVAHGTVNDHIRIVLVLDGSVDVAYGNRQVRLASPPKSAGSEHAPRDAAMVTMLEPDAFRRVLRPGEAFRLVSIGLSRQWIEETLCDGEAGTAYLATSHLDTSFWTASPHARMLAEQMLNPTPLQPQLINMYLESRTIELVTEALAKFHRTGPQPVRQDLRPTVHQRMCELKAWLSENASMPLGMEQIARQMNTTPSTLQRHFRLTHGVTVFDFLHQERLRQALQALKRNGVSVSEAASVAGYTNAASFATAFKRQFGLSPRQVRLRR